MRSRSLKTGFWIALALLALVAICLFTPARLLFDQVALVMQLHKLGPIAALIFVSLFTVATSLGFPGNVMTIAGGAVFGLFWGTVWSAIGATLGAVGAFWLARYLLHGWAERRFGHHPLLQRLQRAIAHNPLSFVLAVRFTPISPFSLVNFLFGLTPIDLKTYTVGTFLGILPLTVAYTWLGVAGQTALQGGDRLPFFLALGALAVLALLPILTRRTKP